MIHHRHCLNKNIVSLGFVYFYRLSPGGNKVLIENKSSNLFFMHQLENDSKSRHLARAARPV